MKVDGRRHFAWPRSEDQDELLDAEQVAAILKVRPCTVGDWARRGILPSFKLGKFRRFSRAAILGFLADQH